MKSEEIAVVYTIKIKLSLWDAFKLRLAGFDVDKIKTEVIDDRTDVNKEQ